MGKFLFGAALALTLGAGTAFAEVQKPPAQAWSFNGVFGTFDRPARRHGRQVHTGRGPAGHGLGGASAGAGAYEKLHCHGLTAAPGRFIALR